MVREATQITTDKSSGDGHIGVIKDVNSDYLLQGTEIRELYATLAINEHISSLDVAVRQALPMDVH